MSVPGFFKKPFLSLLDRWGVRVETRAPEMRRRFKRFGRSWIHEPLGLFKNPQYMSIGSGVCIEANVTVEAEDYYPLSNQRFSPVFEIGDGTHIRSYSSFYCSNSIKIGKNVLIGRYAMVTDLSHSYDDLGKPVNAQPITEGGWVVIEDECFIGHGAMILRNVRIGKHAIVGAGAVVTRDVPPYTVVAGNPAAVLCQYDENSREWKRLHRGSAAAVS